MILRVKTINDKFLNLPNNDKYNNPFCRLKLLVETFVADHSKKRLN